MSNDAATPPSDATLAALPKFLIVREDNQAPASSTEVPKEAEHMAHQMARENGGKYVAIYQRVVVIRKSC